MTTPRYETLDGKPLAVFAGRVYGGCAAALAAAGIIREVPPREPAMIWEVTDSVTPDLAGTHHLATWIVDHGYGDEYLYGEK